MARQFTIEDWALALAKARISNDREAAILGTSMVDRGLEVALQSKFVDLSKRQKEVIFEGSGPLASFSSKIKIAHALGLISIRVKEDLEKIRSVRNVFAHSLLDVSFETPEINNTCSRINFPSDCKDICPELDSEWEIDSPKGKYLMAVFLYAVLFISTPSEGANAEPEASAIRTIIRGLE